MNIEHTHIPFIRTLLADKSEEEIKNAEERFLDFINLAERVHTRIEKEEQTKP